MSHPIRASMFSLLSISPIFGKVKRDVHLFLPSCYFHNLIIGGETSKDLKQIRKVTNGFTKILDPEASPTRHRCTWSFLALHPAKKEQGKVPSLNAPMKWNFAPLLNADLIQGHCNFSKGISHPVRFARIGCHCYRPRGMETLNFVERFMLLSIHAH